MCWICFVEDVLEGHGDGRDGRQGLEPYFLRLSGLWFPPLGGLQMLPGSCKKQDKSRVTSVSQIQIQKSGRFVPSKLGKEMGRIRDFDKILDPLPSRAAFSCFVLELFNRLIYERTPRD